MLMAAMVDILIFLNGSCVTSRIDIHRCSTTCVSILLHKGLICITILPRQVCTKLAQIVSGQRCSLQISCAHLWKASSCWSDCPEGFMHTTFLYHCVRGSPTLTWTLEDIPFFLRPLPMWESYCHLQITLDSDAHRDFASIGCQLHRIVSQQPMRIFI